VPLIAFVNAVVMGLGDGAYKLISERHSAIEWPNSFWILFWYTFILATFVGAILAPIMTWVGAKLPKPKLRYLLIIGLVFGPLPFVLLEGSSVDSSSGLLVFSILGGLSSILWWYLVEKHRTDIVFKHA
jgi:hypothetical protein